MEAGVSSNYAPDSTLATGWGTAFKDFDNDRDLDLYVVNGYVPAAAFIANARENPNHLYENNGLGEFTRVAQEVESSLWGRGLACADIDNDGDMDFLIGNVNKQATSDTTQLVQLFRNDSPLGNNWLKIRLEGSTNNRDGLGSQILLKADGTWSLQEANGGYGTHASQHSSIVHFGLGKAAKIDSLIITWIGGNRQVITGLPVNQFISIKEESLVSTSTSTIPSERIQLSSFPNPFKESTTIQYQLLRTSKVAITIYDQLGRTIYHQTEEEQLEGLHQIQWRAHQPGIYFIHLQTDNHILYKTIISSSR